MPSNSRATWKGRQVRENSCQPACLCEAAVYSPGVRARTSASQHNIKAGWLTLPCLVMAALLAGPASAGKDLPVDRDHEVLQAADPPYPVRGPASALVTV